MSSQDYTEQFNLHKQHLGTYSGIRFVKTDHDRYVSSMPSDVIIMRAGCECGAAPVTSDPQSFYERAPMVPCEWDG